MNRPRIEPEIVRARNSRTIFPPSTNFRPIEVDVGPPLVTINRGDTFVVSEPDGCITAFTDQGIYSRDTGYVSSYEIYADGEHWVLQNSSAIAYYASRTYLTNPKIMTEYIRIRGGRSRKQ
jgi:N-terminal domain of (some) glycogen debranching enzymes